MTGPQSAATPRRSGTMLSTGPWFAALIALLALAGLGLFIRGVWPSAGELVWLAGFAATFAIRLPHVRANKANRITNDRHDLSERILLPCMFLAMVVLPLAAITTPFLDFADYRLGDWALLAALPLQGLFLWLFWRSHADLGRNWSPGLEVRDGHQIIETGVYARIRHPMYAAIWLGALAQPLLIQNWLGGAFILVAFAAMYVIRVPREEAMLAETFGTAYRDYMTRTGRIWPR